jgi:hypothetical protein
MNAWPVDGWDGAAEAIARHTKKVIAAEKEMDDVDIDWRDRKLVHRPRSSDPRLPERLENGCRLLHSLILLVWPSIRGWQVQVSHYDFSGGFVVEVKSPREIVRNDPKQMIFSTDRVLSGSTTDVASIKNDLHELLEDATVDKT